MTYFVFYFIKSALIKLNKIFKRLNLKVMNIPDLITRYERECIGWYVDETNARAKDYMKQFDRIKYYETDIESLNDYDGVSGMFRFLGCVPKGNINNIIGKKADLLDIKIPKADG